MGSGRASRIVYQETCGVVVSGLAGRRAGFAQHSPFDFQAQREASFTDPTAADYFARQLGKPFQQVRRGTLYRLWAEHEDAASARAAALQVAVTRTRRQGLLMNPHAQSVEVLRVWSHRPAEDA